jgi:hypothetical protein
VITGSADGSALGTKLKEGTETHCRDMLKAEEGTKEKVERALRPRVFGAEDPGEVEYGPDRV